MAKPVTVLVTSGKGGVGKSTIATSLAAALAKRGHRTLLIDTDVDGPSCARLLAVMGKAMEVGNFMSPVVARENLWLYAVNLHPFVAVDNMPVVMLGETTRMWLKEIVEAIGKSRAVYDYIIYDCPANHGDELHTIAHLVGAPTHTILVTSPSVVSTDKVELAVKALEEMGFPILGIVSNLSYWDCECGRRSHPLGEGHAREICTKHDLELIGELPISQAVSGRMAETGEALNNPAIYGIVERLEKKPSLWKRLAGG